MAHVQADHPAVGRLACVQAYQAANKKNPGTGRTSMPALRSGNNSAPMFKGDKCSYCGFDEAWHGLTEADYTGDEKPEKRARFDGR